MLEYTTDCYIMYKTSRLLTHVSNLLVFVLPQIFNWILDVFIINILHDTHLFVG